jgi:AraC-like DNA-binding protein
MSILYLVDFTSASGSGNRLEAYTDCAIILIIDLYKNCTLQNLRRCYLSFKDIIALTPEFPFNMFTSGGAADKSFKLHFHDCLELNYIYSGGGINLIENKEYPLIPGDFYIINNLEHHYAYSDGSLKMLVIVFDPEFIWKNTPMDYDYLKPFFNRSLCFSNRITRNELCYDELTSILKKLEKEWAERKEGYRLLIKAQLMNLLAILYRHLSCNGEIGEDIKAFSNSYERLRKVIEYINTHYTSSISLEELAKVALMNRTYFSSYFKNVMKVNVSDYIEKLRVENICRLLRTTSKSITEINVESGLNSFSHFDRVFKKHLNLTPYEYRHQKSE